MDMNPTSEVERDSRWNEPKMEKTNKVLSHFVTQVTCKYKRKTQISRNKKQLLCNTKSLYYQGIS